MKHHRSTGAVAALAASLLGGCDRSALALDPVPLDAGLYPDGGGSVDKRLAACEWKTTLSEEGREDYVETIRYDLWGRQVFGEATYGDATDWRTETTYDVFGCPVAVTAAFRDDIGMLQELELSQTCDLMGYVSRSSSDWGDERFINHYNPAGVLVRRDYAIEDEDPRSRVDLKWFGNRVVSWVQSDPETGEEEWWEDYTYRLDGWVSSYAELDEVETTWSYDAGGRVVNEDGSYPKSFAYHDALSAIPSTAVFDGDPVRYDVHCPL